MSTLNDDDLFLYEDATTGTVGSVANNNRSSLQDDDLFLVERLGVVYRVKSVDVGSASGSGGNSLSPGLPPFGSFATTETVLNSADGKVEFSLDGINYATNLTVPINTFYYVDWGNDILSATHGDPYTAQITATYTDLGASDTIDFEIKLPAPIAHKISPDTAK